MHFSPSLLYLCIQKTQKYNTMDNEQLKALAKINLGLDVLRRREDGYHDVRMIMQTVRIFDRLALVKQDKEGIRVRTNLYYLPANENNLVYKAANLLFEEFDIRGGLSIDMKNTFRWQRAWQEEAPTRRPFCTG